MVSKGPAPVRMVTPPCDSRGSPSRGAEMATTSRRELMARWPALMRGVSNVSFSSSFVDATSTNVTLGSASVSTSPPPFVMTSVLPSSTRWQSCGLWPWVGNSPSSWYVLASRITIRPFFVSRWFSVANNTCPSRENAPCP